MRICAPHEYYQIFSNTDEIYITDTKRIKAKIYMSIIQIPCSFNFSDKFPYRPAVFPAVDAISTLTLRVRS